jgi:hypothetical protein
MENNMAKPKAKFKKNDVFVHKEQKATLIVDNVSYMGKKGWLYDLRTVTDQKPEWKRYYEDKVLDKCAKLKDTKAIKVLYGKR